MPGAHLAPGIAPSPSAEADGVFRVAQRDVHCPVMRSPLTRSAR
jgi:hypothetical protein